jgi:hypothetical protein
MKTITTKRFEVFARVFLLSFVGVVFFLPVRSFASVLVEQTDTGAVWDSQTAGGGSGYPSAIIDVTGLSSQSVLTSLTFNYRQKEAWDVSCQIDQGYSVILHRAAGNMTLNNAFLPSTDWQMVMVDISSLGVKAGELTAIELSSVRIGCENGYPYLGQRMQLSGSSGNPNAYLSMLSVNGGDFDPYLVLKSNDNTVYFKNPPATSGAVLKDFNNWQVCVNFSATSPLTAFKLGLMVWPVGDPPPVSETSLGSFTKPAGAYQSCYDLVSAANTHYT